MTDPLVFYNMEDMWEIPRELYAGQEQPVESYYLIMKLPPDENSDGTEEEEFILLLPFNPAGLNGSNRINSSSSVPSEFSSGGSFIIK